MSYKKGKFYIPEEQLISLVEGAKQGDKKAKGELYLTFEGYLSRYIGTKVPTEKVDELVTDTIMDAYDNIHQLSEPVALTRWLRSIAHSKIYHFHKDKERERKREEKRKRKEAQERLREIKRTSGIDLSKMDIQDAVNTLPAKQKEAVLLRKQGFKVKEIAKLQNVSEGTVKSRLNYARKKVNAYVEAGEFENSNPYEPSI